MALLMHRPAASQVPSRGAARSAGAAPLLLGAARVAAARLPRHTNCRSDGEPAAVARRRAVLTRAAAGEGSDIPASAEDAMRESAGWQANISFGAFWLQLALTLVSAGVLLFSVFVTMAGGQGGKAAVDFSKFFTLGGVVLSFVSTFFAHGFLSLARRLRAGGSADLGWLSRSLVTNSTINLVGIALTTVGLQASVGTLVGKTLLSTVSQPYSVNQAGALVSVDVFALQASTNVLLAHLVGLAFVNLMTRVLNKAAPRAAIA